jgi:hypothetical protein
MKGLVLQALLCLLALGDVPDNGEKPHICTIGILQYAYRRLDVDLRPVFTMVDVLSVPETRLCKRFMRSRLVFCFVPAVLNHLF